MGQILTRRLGRLRRVRDDTIVFILRYRMVSIAATTRVPGQTVSPPDGRWKARFVVRRIASDAYANAVYVWLGPDLPLARRPLAFCYPPSQGLFKESSLG